MEMKELIEAAKDGEKKKIIEHIKEGLPIGFDDDLLNDGTLIFRESALISSSRNDHIETVAAIFEHATPNAYNQEDLVSSLQHTNSLEIAKMLVEHGADVKDEFVIKHACQNGKIDIVKYLHEQGAELTTNDLEYAVGGNHLELVKYFDEHGCTVKDNPQCLGVAIWRGNNQVAHYCLMNGADPNYKNDHNLKVAASNGNYGASKMLIVDFNMPVSQNTKDWLEMKGADDVLELIKKRDFNIKLNSKLNTKQDKSLRMKI